MRSARKRCQSTLRWGVLAGLLATVMAALALVGLRGAATPTIVAAATTLSADTQVTDLRQAPRGTAAGRQAQPTATPF